jgi:hypothetical protein
MLLERRLVAGDGDRENGFPGHALVSLLSDRSAGDEVHHIYRDHAAALREYVIAPRQLTPLRPSPRYFEGKNRIAAAAFVPYL